MKALQYSLILTTLLFFNKIEANTDLIREAVDNPHRKEENKERDVYRNPYETLNFFELDRSKKVLEITENEGVPAVFDGVGKKTFHGSLACLKTRGMMISFGNASGPLDPVNVRKDIQPKGLYLVRPSMQHYLGTKEQIEEGAKLLFDKIESGKIKIEIFKKYSLNDVVQAHKDLESRKILGPAIIVPN